MNDPARIPLIAARRDQILDAAATVFAARGFHPTTVREVARAAGVADGTIYNYFENKTALLLGILDRMTASAATGAEHSRTSRRGLSQLSRGVSAPRADDPPGGQLRVVPRGDLGDSGQKNCGRCTTRRFSNRPWRRRKRTFSSGRHHTPSDRVNIRLTMRAISGMVLGLILQHIMGDETLEAQWEALPDFLADLIIEWHWRRCRATVNRTVM